MRLTLLAVLCVGYATAQGGTQGFNKLIAMELPTINTQLQSAIPQSIGKCDGAAPPCQTFGGNPDHGNDLYYVHKVRDALDLCCSLIVLFPLLARILFGFLDQWILCYPLLLPPRVAPQL